MTASQITDIIGQLTLEEKASLCPGSDAWHLQAIERLGISGPMITDGLHGLRKVSDGSPADIYNSIPATCFPTAAGLASTWNPDLIAEVGVALGQETRAERVGVLLGPGINMKRSPLCGRNFEHFSEDPVLTGVIATELVAVSSPRGSVPLLSISLPITRRPTV